MPYGDVTAPWRDLLDAKARVIFHCEERANSAQNFAAIADGFVTRHGFKPIGFNWELLDPLADTSEPRSARAIITQAFAEDMRYPQQDWLGEGEAAKLAGAFLNLFDLPRATILSNRFGDLWNPLTDAEIEWGFVGFDETRIALLLATT